MNSLKTLLLPFSTAKLCFLRTFPLPAIPVTKAVVLVTFYDKAPYNYIEHVFRYTIDNK